MFETFEVRGVVSSVGDPWKPPRMTRAANRAHGVTNENAVIRSLHGSWNLWRLDDAADAPQLLGT